MTAVFVHGVPDTHRVWSLLLTHLECKEVVALSLPGFDSPVPDGFAATKEAYVDWLIATLEGLPSPLDVVGHDWGSLVMVRVLSLRPDLIRSWAGGGVPVSGDYVWHPTARLWQTQSAGEKSMDRLDAALAARMLAKAGMPVEMAAETARHIDPTMRDCILRLYRSGIDVFREWEPDLTSIRAPGLVLWGEADVYAEPRFADRLGQQTGAKVVRFNNCGHWWQCQEPQKTAEAVQLFWREVGAM